jgi:predicted dehydrogenase
LAIISSPLQFHAAQIVAALAEGSHVLCEKPLCVTVDEGERIIEVKQKSGKLVSIGYQWSFSTAILELKKEISSGRLGRPLRFKTIMQWPRNFAYYGRNRWAGRIRDEQGCWVLDSVVSNATAHYLHNMFYLLGPAWGESAFPASVTAELYRANAIENYDTAALRIHTTGGTELLYYATHATLEKVEPLFSFEFEEAVVTYNQNEEGQIIATFRNGEKRVYGDPTAGNEEKLWMTIAALKTGKTVPCGPEAALPQVICVNGIQEVGTIQPFPGVLIKHQVNDQGEADGVYVEGLNQALMACYEEWLLPHEAGIPWAQAGKTKHF